ncbi:hypothetical protein OV203_45480 [Nannocystis sp. ILAH1]|uniref:hypothetical protein n=1 Tax=unclassified Nannocystis TaxID=2627009 RepID=UPI00226DEC59|nr:MULTISPECIES: hypothetical protein [unclassified Nannocystis]MCY0994461.1 hypothetical protein [Nannocystis sp. ILAH1]MCY1063547.1 hypothetical protein [Nannocystis sp. RBIL2]
MRKDARGWWMALVLFGAPACFQSDFVLYGPVCEDAAGCEGALGERDGDRVCFFPRIDVALGPGYCTVLCNSDACDSQDGTFLECIPRMTQEGESLSVCAFTCTTDADCPERMTCANDPSDGERKLCVP